MSVDAVASCLVSFCVNLFLRLSLFPTTPPNSTKHHQLLPLPLPLPHHQHHPSHKHTNPFCVYVACLVRFGLVLIAGLVWSDPIWFWSGSVMVAAPAPGGLRTVASKQRPRGPAGMVPSPVPLSPASLSFISHFL